MNTDPATNPQDRSRTSTMADLATTEASVALANGQAIASVGDTVTDGSGAVPAPARPRLVGDYEILEEIAHGGMGVVYRARDRELKREIALKMIRGGIFASADDITRFQREAQAIARLQHPNIIQVLDFGWYERLPYFTMKLADSSLSKKMKKFVEQPRAGVELVEKVARAVHVAHQCQILHRDLKPGNILLDADGEPLVTDFGLVKMLDDTLDLTRTGELLGTPSYMAPEQLRKGPPARLGPQTDVWSLGVILFELMAGRKPFKGETREAVSTLILTADPPSISSLRPNVDRDLETIVGKCLEKEPARRYASAAELADDLARWLRQEPVRARPMSWPRRAARQLHRHALIGALVLTVAAAAAAMLIVQHINDPERPLQLIKAQLARGETVTLVGPTGPPAWSRAAVGEAFTSTDANKPFYLKAGPELHLLELVPADTLTAYRFGAQIWHEEQSSSSKAGLYIGQETKRGDNGKPHHFYAPYYFDDLHAASDGQSDVNLRVFWHSEGEWLNMGRFLVSHRFVPANKLPDAAGQPRWRQIALEVFPDRIAAYWEGEKVRDVPAAKLHEASQKLTERRPVHVPRFGPDGGLGLCVHGSTVHFKNVVVQPLVPNP